MRIVRLFFLLCFGLAAHAQESPSPTPSPSSPPAIAIRFALPPMEGTISLGIYNHSGKLVRVLHREDTVADFTAGHDALETTWDGKDDAGNLLPPGKYNARGFVAGDLKVEGVGYFFNDWVTDENSPHITHLSQPSLHDDELRINAELTGGRKIALVCDQKTGNILSQIPADANPGACDSAQAKDGTTWLIDLGDQNRTAVVKQVSTDPVLLRQLEYSKDDPQPECIQASAKENKIFLLERNLGVQRFRALTLAHPAAQKGGKSVSDWKTDFEKQIVTHKNFSVVNGKPVANAPNDSSAPEKISQSLVPNPLQRNNATKIELAVGIDSDGSYLKTADGLPLRTISETPSLSRALIVKSGDKTADVFQDDGAVVEQFRISNLGQMMAFDCGNFDLK